MKLEDAAEGQRVLYTPPGSRSNSSHQPRDSDYGTVTSTSSLYVFVRYADQPPDAPGRATYAQDLTLRDTDNAQALRATIERIQ